MSNSQNNEHQVWQAIGHYVFPLIALAMVGCGADAKIMPVEEAEAVARAVIKELDGPTAMFYKPTDGSVTEASRYELHVDMSVNMKGFLADGDSVFRRCLNVLTEQLAGRIQVKPFGTVREGGCQLGETLSTHELNNPESYDRSDSDLAWVIQPFTNQMDVTHLVLTDGVQWNMTNQNYYGDVKCAADAFMKQGGSVALMIFRSSFKGEYTSMSRVKEGKHRLQCVLEMEAKSPGRPFILWVFLKKGDTLASFSRLLERDNVKPESTVAMTGTEISAVPWDLQLRLTKGQEGKAVGEPFLRHYCTYSPYDLNPFSVKFVNPRVIDPDEYAPFQFEIKIADGFTNKMASTTVEAQRAWLEKNVSVDLRCWPVARQKDRRLALTNEITKLNFKASAKHAFFVPEWPLEKANGKKLTEDQQALPSSVEKARSVYLKVNVARPTSSASLFAWVLTLKLKDAYELIPEELSTKDDSTADQAERIFNLRPMMGTAMSEACVPARTLILTKWAE